MKRFIFAILFLAAFGFSTMPNVAMARRHHRVVHYRYVRGRRVVYRTVGSRSHGVNANGNVGVGLGPIHVGVGAGGGVQLHEALPPRNDPPNDPPSDASGPTSMNSDNPSINPQISTNGHFIVHPSDCDLECFVDTNAVVVWHSSANATPTNQSIDVRRVQERFALSPNTNINDYYATYLPPRVVTVGGFSVPVVGNSAYYSPFKHGRNGFFYVHNHKGVDATAGFGVSPRGGPLPESIGGTGYTVTTVEQ